MKDYITLKEALNFVGKEVYPELWKERSYIDFKPSEPAPN